MSTARCHLDSSDISLLWFEHSYLIIFDHISLMSSCFQAQFHSLWIDFTPGENRCDGFDQTHLAPPEWALSMVLQGHEWCADGSNSWINQPCGGSELPNAQRRDMSLSSKKPEILWYCQRASCLQIGNTGMAISVLWLMKKHQQSVLWY